MKFFNGHSIDYKKKKVIISDLDGTLTESKMKVSPEMSRAIERATRLYHFAVVSGGSFSQFKKQLVNGISNERQYLSKILLFPTNGTKLFRYVDDKWIKVYSMNLKVKDRKTIVEGFTRMIGEYEFAKPNIIYGPQVEDRISQVTFSALGQFAPLSQKMEWDSDGSKRMLMKERLEQLLPDFEIRIGGTTSLDVTKRGLDKSYAVTKMRDITGFDNDEMVFIGDALFKNGNDYAVRSTKIQCVQVDSVKETLAFLNELISQHNNQVRRTC